MSTAYPYPPSYDSGAQAPPAPPYTLFDSMSVAIATLLGSPIAGTSLMAINYHRLKSGGKGFAAVAIGLAATVFAVLFGNKLPSFLSLTIAIGLLLLTKSCAQILQGQALAYHVNSGGKLGSRWAAAGIGVACLAVIFGAVFIYYLGHGRTHGESKVVIGTKDTVYYSGSATKGDAESLGRELKDTGYLTDRGVSVFLSKDQTGTVVSFTVRNGAWDQPEMIIAFDQIGGQVARLSGEPNITVRLVDTNREVKKEMTAGEVISGTKDAIFYTGTATQAEARALGQALVSAGYLIDNGANVTLSKGDETVISFVVGDGAWDSPQKVNSYENTIRNVAPSVGGLPIKLRLFNSLLSTKKEVLVQ